MNFDDILEQVWFYLQVASPSVAEVRQAVLMANMLQEQAMLRENLNGLLENVSLTIAPGGSTPIKKVSVGDWRVYGVKEAWLVSNGQATRMKVQTEEAFYAERGRYALNGDNFSIDSSEFASCLGQAPRLVIAGERARLFPALTTTAEVTVFAYVRPLPIVVGPTPPGTDAEDNYILRHGSQWLMWSLVVALNFRYQIFTQRQEGTVPPPVAQAERAWMEFLAYDKSVHASSSANVI